MRVGEGELLMKAAVSMCIICFMSKISNMLHPYLVYSLSYDLSPNARNDLGERVNSYDGYVISTAYHPRLTLLGTSYIFDPSSDPECYTFSLSHIIISY